MEGQLFPWLAFPFLVVFAFVPLWSAELAGALMIVARPLATKFLAKTFWENQ